MAWLAEKSEVRWCMIIKPYGFAIWEKIQHILDTMFKNTGHQNAYFPLLIPKSYLSQEADHVEWFAKECAVVTHHRLRTSASGGVEVDPEAKLEEELIIRPTSETIIWKTYKNWINSYRDLPLLINQWANVMRREMRTRIFLRTSEFLWQEWHTAHATAEEAQEEAEQMLEVYKDFVNQYLSMYTTPGHKSPSERFAGAVDTLTIETMMWDAKALQSGTSHFLWQNFAKAFDVTYLTSDNTPEYVWATSWWVSTRIIGGMIMAHSDDAGLVLPPAIAPIHVVVVPIYKTAEEFSALEAYIWPELEKLRQETFSVTSQYAEIDTPVKVKVDTDEQKSAGWKFAERELKWVPVRIAVGKRDMEQGVVEVARRDTGSKESVAIADLTTYIMDTLYDMQTRMLHAHQQFTEAHTQQVETRDEFTTAIEAGFVLAHWDGTEETEAAIKEATKATIRCIPFGQQDEAGVCVYSGKPSTKRVLFARAY